MWNLFAPSIVSIEFQRMSAFHLYLAQDGCIMTVGKHEDKLSKNPACRKHRQRDDFKTRLPNDGQGQVSRNITNTAKSRV